MSDRLRALRCYGFEILHFGGLALPVAVAGHYGTSGLALLEASQPTRFIMINDSLAPGLTRINFGRAFLSPLLAHCYQLAAG